jgi:hypothetical protein
MRSDTLTRTRTAMMTVPDIYTTLRWVFNIKLSLFCEEPMCLFAVELPMNSNPPLVAYIKWGIPSHNEHLTIHLHCLHLQRPHSHHTSTMAHVLPQDLHQLWRKDVEWEHRGATTGAWPWTTATIVPQMPSLLLFLLSTSRSPWWIVIWLNLFINVMIIWVHEDSVVK